MCNIYVFYLDGRGLMIRASVHRDRLHTRDRKSHHEEHCLETQMCSQICKQHRVDVWPYRFQTRKDDENQANTRYLQLV